MKKILTFVIAALIYSGLSAANYFVDPSRVAASGDGTSWTNAYKTLGEAETAANGNAVVDNIYIKGGVGGVTISSTSGWTLKAENYYFSCDPSNTGTLTVRTMNDNDGNGIVEPWEFKYPTLFKSTYSGGNAITLVTSTTLDGLFISNTNSDNSAILKSNGASTTFTNPAGGTVLNCVFSGSNLSYINMCSSHPGGCLIKNFGDFKDCLIEKNTVTVNITANYEIKITPFFEFNFTAGTNPTLSRCVFRNNSAAISSSATATFTGAYFRGLIVNVVSANSITATATTSNCLIYNNEIAYSNTGTVASLPNASIVGVLNFSNNTTVDAWINNTIANNKMTNGNSAMFVPSNATQFHKIYNNVFWNNQNNGTPVSMRSGSNQTTGGSNTIIANNIMDCAAAGNWSLTANYFTDNFNKIDLSSINTTANKGPQFINPTSIVGNSNGGMVEKADWRINNSTSYLIGKGVATGTTTITTDKAGNNFVTATPAAGAYEATAISPTITGITAGNTILSVVFTAPAYDGGSAITNYKYSIDGGVTFTACSSPQTTSPISITGLSNGTSYNVQIKAVNANGDGAASASSTGIPVAAGTTPAAPIINSIASGNAQLSINFSQGSDGGSAITDYQYSTDNGDNFVTIGSTANPLVITTQSTSGTPALVNGTSYNVQIKAVNGNGAGLATASMVATPSGTSAAPTSITITPGNTTLSVAFTAASNGGTTITNYKYSTNDGATFIACSPVQTTSPIIINNLNYATQYKVQIKAVNAAGDGTATASTTVTTTGTTPSTPIITGITAASTSLSVVFTAPTNTGGSSITNYKYSTDGGTTWSTRTPAATTSPLAITLQSTSGTPALVNGTSYNIQIKAVNANGDSPASNTSNGIPVSAATTPAAPIINSITAGSATLVVNFSPGSNGGSAITGYKYSFNGTNFSSSIASFSAITKLIDGTTNLTNGTSYTVYIRAVNANGDGVVSNGIAASPVKPEPNYQATNFAKGAVTSSAIPLTFTSAVAGAQAPDGYLVKMSTGTVTDPVDSTDPTDVTVLTGGIANVKVTTSPVSSFTGLTAGTMYHYKIYSYTNSSSQINFNTTSAPTLDVATSPAAVTGVIFTPTLTDFGASTLTANLSWTNPASFDDVNHTTLVFVKYNNAITVGTPTNAASTYTSSTNMVSGSTGTAYQGDASAYCVYKGTGTSVSLSGMTTGANYYVLVLTVYNTANSDGTCSYSSSVGATANATMYKKEPVSYPANLAVSNVTSTSISLTWTPSVSNSQAPDGYMVISKALQNITYPVDGTDQADVTAYTNNVANIKVSPQSATGISSFTNMTAGTTYYYKVFPYTNSGAQINYKTSGSVPSLTYATLPNAVTNVSFSSSTATSATINWAAASGYSSTRHSTLVFIKAGSTITLGTPVLAPTAYTANTIFGSGTAYEGDAEAYCVYNGDGTSISVTGLSTNTNYHVLVYTVVDAQNTNLTNSYSAAATTNALAISSTSNISSLAVNSGSELNISAGELVINQNTTVNTVIIAPGAKLSLGAGNTLTATNGITLQSDATGTATFVDTNNDAPQAVSGTVQQYLTAERNWYTASPITAGTAASFSLGTSVQSYSESAKSWSILSGGDALVAGKGYVSVATTGTGTTGTVSFNGTLNTGTIAVPVTRTESGSSRGFNLVANPYPSYLDWSLVKADGANANIGSTMWFRTKNTLGAYTFATHNGTSGETVTGTANTTITKFIPPLQAFWIRVNANVNTGDVNYPNHLTSITFKNSMRAHRDDNGNKLKAPKVNERTRLRLQLANGTETDETLIYFDSNATNDFNDYDSPKMLNNSAKTPDLYSKVGNERLVINGLKEISDNLELPLGFSLNSAATLKLKATEISNFPAGTRIYLLDKVENKQTELTPESEYSFSPTAATTNNESRFSLVFRVPGNTTGIDNSDKLNTQVFVNANNQIAIITPEKANYSIYNAVGQLIENGIVNMKHETRNTKLSSGVYVVKVNNQSTRVIIK